MDISKHPILRKCFDVIQAIEVCGASVELTTAVIMAGELLQDIDKLISDVNKGGLEMTKDEFKKRWESDDAGGGITFNDIADCAVEWNISRTPRTMQIDSIRYRVLKAALVNDAEEFSR